MFAIKKKILFKDWIYEWLLEKKNYVKESTYANYSNYVFTHIIPGLGDIYIQDLNHKIIQDFLLDLFKNGKKDGSGGLSEKTIKDITIILKGSLKKAINEERIKNIGLSFIYPKDDKTARVYVLSELEQMRITNYALGNLSNKSLGLLISLYFGLRIGELCALQWRDIDFENGILHVNKTIQRVYIKDRDNNYSKVIITNPKTKNANREIPISKNFLKIFKDMKTKGTDYVITGSKDYFEPRTYRAYFDRTLKSLDIKSFNFHSLRHTFATNCISMGADYKTASELLGHSNVNITLNLYVHPRLSQKQECIEMVCKGISR